MDEDRDGEIVITFDDGTESGYTKTSEVWVVGPSEGVPPRSGKEQLEAELGETRRQLEALSAAGP